MEGTSQKRPCYSCLNLKYNVVGELIDRCDVVTPRDRCARCLLVIHRRYHVIFLRVAFHHVIMCIASSCFQNLHPSGFPQFPLLSVLSPDTLAHARGMSEILFYKWPENVLGMG